MKKWLCQVSSPGGENATNCVALLRRPCWGRQMPTSSAKVWTLKGKPLKIKNTDRDMCSMLKHWVIVSTVARWQQNVTYWRYCNALCQQPLPFAVRTIPVSDNNIQVLTEPNRFSYLLLLLPSLQYLAFCSLYLCY